MNPKTMILRFRDLVTSENGTIEQHKAIIDNHGYVWWAWWKKGGEKIPNDFSLLSTRVKEGPVCVFLVDSGRNILYRAICDSIKVRTSTKIPSPEKDKTPTYYCDQNYYAWFKFTKIEQCDKSELKQYSYIHCKDLFDDENINYSSFENKRIHSISELVQQNRTVWFVREAEEADPDNEIILLNADIIQPLNFSKKYYQVPGDTLLWLSDLHLSDNVFGHVAGKARSTLTQHICSCIGSKKLAGLLISGDITSRAERNGFQIAEQLLGDINNEVFAPLNSENILICPGNHDFKRASTDLPAGSEPSWIYDNDDSTKEFAELYHSIYKLKPNQYFASGKKILLSSGHILEIVALNSLMLQQYPNFDGHGYLSQEQLDYVAEQMGWDDSKNQNAIRIVMMHHHYLPTCYVEVMDVNRASSVVYDADRLMNWLTKYNVKLLLHGHKHKSFVAQISYPKEPGQNNITTDELHQVAIVGMGGTGAKGADNKLATISFDNDEMIIQFYRLYSDQISQDQICQTVKMKL